MARPRAARLHRRGRLEGCLGLARGRLRGFGAHGAAARLHRHGAEHCAAGAMPQSVRPAGWRLTAAPGRLWFDTEEEFFSAASKCASLYFLPERRIFFGDKSLLPPGQQDAAQEARQRACCVDVLARMCTRMVVCLSRTQSRRWVHCSRRLA